MKIEDVGPTDTVEFIVHGAFVPRLRAWVERQGLIFQENLVAPDGGPGALPSFFIFPGPELMSRAALLDDER